MLSTRREAIVGAIATIGVPFVGNSYTVRSMLAGNETRMLSSENPPPEYYTASDYVQDGLVGLFDGEENIGWEQHETNPTNWINLVCTGNISLVSGVVFGDSYATTDDSFSGKEFGRIDNWDKTSPYGYISSEICFETDSTERQFIILDLYRRCSMGVWDTNIGVGHWRAVPYGKSTYGELITASSIYPSYTDNIPSSQYVDGQFKELINVNFSQPLSSGFCVGGSPYDKAFSGKLHCIRLYNRSLTAEEVVWNNRVDKIRFGT